jgi:hypothetical protein
MSLLFYYNTMLRPIVDNTKHVNIYFQLCLRIFATDLKTLYGLSQLTIKALQMADSWCDHVRGLMETLSVSAVSVALRGAHLGHGRSVSPCGRARAKGQKFGARQRHGTPMGRKRSVFLSAGATQYGGITQTLRISGTPRYYTHRYKPHNKMSTFRFTFATWL